MKFQKKIAGSRRIPYTHIETTVAETVCFMFSDLGYTYDKPLFYYATMAMLEHRIDVVHVHYAYSGDFLEQPLDAISAAMMNDIAPVVNEVLSHASYNKTMFLGKSLGTIPIIHEIMKRDVYAHSNMILLTPLLKWEPLFAALQQSKHKGLLVIGDKDPHYNKEKLERLRETNFSIHVIERANHSLDIEPCDTSRSMAALAEVMQKLRSFITATS